MIQMLELKAGLSILDLGSGCGLSGNFFGKLGCDVTGFDPCTAAVEIANKYAQKLGVQNYVDYSEGYTNDLIGNKKFDRIHSGYMLKPAMAKIYCDKHLNNGGLAVVNVGGQNEGSIFIYRKDDKGKVSIE